MNSRNLYSIFENGKEVSEYYRSFNKDELQQEIEYLKMQGVFNSVNIEILPIKRFTKCYDIVINKEYLNDVINLLIQF